MKFTRILTAALALLLLTLPLTACKTTLTPGENGLYDDKKDIRYINASTVYEAKEFAEEYGVLQLTENESYKLYRIPGVEPEKMLATEDGNIVYASDLTLPTLSEMNAELLHICMDAGSTTYVVGEVSDKKQIDAIIDAYENAPEIRNPGYRPVRNFHVRFESPDHAGFYYALTYVEYAEDVVIEDKNYGRCFLLSLFEGTFAPVDDSIHKVLGEMETEAPADTEEADA